MIRLDNQKINDIRDLFNSTPGLELGMFYFVNRGALLKYY